MLFTGYTGNTTVSHLSAPQTVLVLNRLKINANTCQFKFNNPENHFSIIALCNTFCVTDIQYKHQLLAGTKLKVAATIIKHYIIHNGYSQQQITADYSPEHSDFI
jgi:hypothetical protein